MRKPKLTPWFPADVKPVHVGVYQRNFGKPDGERLVYSKWDGETWLIWGDTPESADRKTVESGFLEEWRGLASPAEQKKEPA